MLHERKCALKECGVTFTTNRKRQIYHHPSCYNKANRIAGKAKNGKYKRHHKPNTKCPYCGDWHYKKEADPKVKRNYCKECERQLGFVEGGFDEKEVMDVSTHLYAAHGRELK